MSTDKTWPGHRVATHVLGDFRFGSGEHLAGLRLGCITLGTPRRSPSDEIINACLLIHNTTGTARSWLTDTLGGELFGPGQPLDAARHYIVMPDMIGTGHANAEAIADYAVPTAAVDSDLSCDLTPFTTAVEIANIS